MPWGRLGIAPGAPRDSYPAVWTFVDRDRPWFGITSDRTPHGGEAAVLVTPIRPGRFAALHPELERLAPKALPPRWSRAAVT